MECAKVKVKAVLLETHACSFVMTLSNKVLIIPITAGTWTPRSDQVRTALHENGSQSKCDGYDDSRMDTLLSAVKGR